MNATIPTLQSLARLGVTLKPLSKPVEGARRWSPFKATWGATLSDLQRELEAHGAELVVLEVGLFSADFRQDGWPRGDRRNPRSAGVRLTFRATKVPGRPLLTFDSGEFSEWGDNVRALALGLHDLRRAERYGITNRGAQYAGFKALPTGGPDPDRGRRLIAERFGGDVRRALRATHPDTREDGFTDQDFADVQALRDADRKASGA